MVLAGVLDEELSEVVAGVEAEAVDVETLSVDFAVAAVVLVADVVPDDVDAVAPCVVVVAGSAVATEVAGAAVAAAGI